MNTIISLLEQAGVFVGDPDRVPLLFGAIQYRHQTITPGPRAGPPDVVTEAVVQDLLQDMEKHVTDAMRDGSGDDEVQLLVASVSVPKAVHRLAWRQVGAPPGSRPNFVAAATSADFAAGWTGGPLVFSGRGAGGPGSRSSDQVHCDGETLLTRAPQGPILRLLRSCSPVLVRLLTPQFQGQAIEPVGGLVAMSPAVSEVVSRLYDSHGDVGAALAALPAGTLLALWKSLAYCEVDLSRSPTSYQDPSVVAALPAVLEAVTEAQRNMRVWAETNSRPSWLLVANVVVPFVVRGSLYRPLSLFFLYSSTGAAHSPLKVFYPDLRGYASSDMRLRLRHRRITQEALLDLAFFDVVQSDDLDNDHNQYVVDAVLSHKYSQNVLNSARGL
jgi:hypothetical protein